MKTDVTVIFFFVFFLGTFAVLSIMVGIVCLQLAPESDFSHFNATLNTTVVDTALMNDVRLGISGTLACLTALIQVFETVSYFKKQNVCDLYDAMSTLNILHVCRSAWGSCSLGS